MSGPYNSKQQIVLGTEIYDRKRCWCKYVSFSGI